MTVIRDDKSGMISAQKRQALIRLQQRIEGSEAADGRHVWLWESHLGANGWLGTDDIMALTLAPGYGHFPSKGNKVLYQCLQSAGMSDLHLTFLFKTRATRAARGDLPLDWDLTERHIEYLMEEVNILSPRLIITFGSDATRILDPFLGDLDVDPMDVRPLPSPFEAARDPQALAEFTQQLALVASEWSSKTAFSCEADEGLSNELDEARDRIVTILLYDRGRQVYFWNRRYGVAGWSGTDPIFIVGSYPSRSFFPTDADIFFYGELRANWLNNAHLTDVLKASASPKDFDVLRADADVMQESKFCLAREIEIIRPRLVVVMGDKARKLIEDWLPDLRRASDLDPSDVVYISHYTAGFYPGKSHMRAQFQQEIRAVAKKFRQLD